MTYGETHLNVSPYVILLIVYVSPYVILPIVQYCLTSLDALLFLERQVGDIILKRLFQERHHQ